MILMEKNYLASIVLLGFYVFYLTLRLPYDY